MSYNAHSVLLERGGGQLVCKLQRELMFRKPYSNSHSSWKSGCDRDTTGTNSQRPPKITLPNRNGKSGRRIREAPAGTIRTVSSFHEADSPNPSFSPNSISSLIFGEPRFAPRLATFDQQRAARHPGLGANRDL